MVQSAAPFGKNGNTEGEGEFELPPSTMAAQLINNLSNTSHISTSITSRQKPQDDLKTLMAEVSAVENTASPFKNEVDKIEHQQKLLYLLARTVLERLTGDDPFMDIPKVVSQASDALDVFVTIIKETPGVLAYTSSPDAALQGRGQEPLWLWLFPRVSALLGRQHCDRLTEKIKDFFFISFQAVCRSPQLWDLTAVFYEYLKQCVATTLSHINRTSVTFRPNVSNIVLPSESFDSSMFYQEKSFSRGDKAPLPLKHCSYTMSGTSSSLMHVTHLLCILSDISIESVASYNVTAAFENYFAWLFESFLLTHEVRKKLERDPELNAACKQSHLMLFHNMGLLLSSIKKHLPTSIVRKGYILLSILAADFLENPTELAGNELQISLSSSILKLVAVCQEWDTMPRFLSLHLVPALKVILDDECLRSNFSKDFQIAANALSKTCGMVNLQESDGLMLQSFENVELGEELQKLELKIDMSTIEYGPPSKRRKIRAEAEKAGLLEQITEKLYRLLGQQDVADLSGLAQITETCFTELKDSDRCKTIEYLAMIPCAADGCLEVTKDRDGELLFASCLFCEEPNTSIRSERAQSSTISHDAISVLANLVRSQAFQGSRRSRVLGMIALRRFAAHFKNEGFIDFNKSALSQWCLKSLKSSIRELRIAAGRTLPGFLRGPGIAQDVMRSNRLAALMLLRQISEENTVQLQETCILAWGQVGRTLNDDELNIVLCKLVEYLGHSNPIISGVAFNEILSLATISDISVERMFAPFWDTIAIIPVQQFISKPQMIQSMADLLGTTVKDFLVMTQSYTLPYLVASMETDVIRRMAAILQNDEKRSRANEHSNLIAVIAFLLMRDVQDMEKYIMVSLKAASSIFTDNIKDSSILELTRSDPAAIALILLRAAADADESKKARIRLGLTSLATWAAPSPEGLKADEISRRRKNPLGAFLEHHILGLVDKVSKVVYDAQSGQSISEKKRCIKAVEEMVLLGKTFTRTARPQMCACLQSALAHEDLQALAFSAWNKMILCLEDEDVDLMLESTFSTIVQRWKYFDQTTRALSGTTLQYLLTKRPHLVRSSIVNLPSLSHIPELATVEEQLKRLRTPTDIGNTFRIFSRRVGHENSGVVYQALVELKNYLKSHQSFLQASAVSEQPDVVVGALVRSILDSCVKFNQSHHEIAQLAGECIGLIGCLDPNRVESVRAQRDMVVLSNFHDPGETTDFVLFLLEEVIVKAFMSSSDTGVQGFLSYTMQMLLEKCDFSEVCVPIIKNGDRNNANPIYMKWKRLPSIIQETLTPFLTSRYSVVAASDFKRTQYPIFCTESKRHGSLYNHWLKNFVFDLLHRPKCLNADLIFEPLRRAIKIRDGTVADFLFPYLVLHVVIEGTDEERQDIGQELLNVLSYRLTQDDNIKAEELKICSEAIFRVLDYLSRWVQAKTVKRAKDRDDSEDAGILHVQHVLNMLPAEIISQRAVECKSYSRALYYWEQHIRQVRETVTVVETSNTLLERLQGIYTQIDEPDGIEGVSAHLHVLDIDQQILSHRKAGRWTAAQSWYEIKLAEEPDDVDMQVNLLTCLKESGQHDVLLNYVEGMHTSTKDVSKLLPFATEASWATGRWLALSKYTRLASEKAGVDFNVSVGHALLAMHQKDTEKFVSTIRDVREELACSMSMASIPSLGACHDTMLKFHVLAELEMIAGTDESTGNRGDILDSLNKRLEVLGAYLNDKQYLLGIRRAAMQVSSLDFNKRDIASAWLTSARLARKGNAVHQSFNSVLRASQLGDESSTIEHARLLFMEGQHRKAIQSLRGAIESNAFMSYNTAIKGDSFPVTTTGHADQQNLLTARAHLLLAKWMDSAGQTRSLTLRSQYQQAVKMHSTWEKCHYYLGRHYNNLLETEKNVSPGTQQESYLTGEMAKLVIESYFRAISFGSKYLYQALPRIITLWLDLGTQVSQAVNPKTGSTREFIERISTQRKEQLAQIHARFARYIARLPAYIFYTAFPQIIARIAHPNAEVYRYLAEIIYKIVATHPQQAIWTLLAVASSTQQDRKSRGVAILQLLRNGTKKDTKPAGIDIKAILKNGERLASELLMVCNAGEFPSNKTVVASITRDLHFQYQKVTPCLLAVPAERILTATLPTLTDKVKGHKAFSSDVVTIQTFLDEVLVLSSLQKPRKLTARGSDGKLYGLLCKPKDDLRKDQRLMEFNSMINRSLKRDAESSRRQLYIKTYAVTPLNEDCGLIEWVEDLKTLRDILLSLYRPLGITPNYREIEALCDEASKHPEKIALFTETVLGRFPPVFHLWFVQQFPEPSAWFTARLRYTRSCAVMSMVGTILGLGDRHGENILFEQGNGGTFHVDFNCLFDKGLTFAKAEHVPFRLTHNMVDAMGIYRYEGPFRKSSELTLKLLRQHQETLMTILEAFVYDPTLDLLTKKLEKKRKEGAIWVPQTPQGVLDAIQRKVKGLIDVDNVPLSVEGQVDDLINRATNPVHLAGMYIGWCAFF